MVMVKPSALKHSKEREPRMSPSIVQATALVGTTHPQGYVAFRYPLHAIDRREYQLYVHILHSAAALAWEAASSGLSHRRTLAAMVLRHRLGPRDPLAIDDDDDAVDALIDAATS